jgi:hypothetical protein
MIVWIEYMAQIWLVVCGNKDLLHCKARSQRPKIIACLCLWTIFRMMDVASVWGCWTDGWRYFWVQHSGHPSHWRRDSAPPPPSTGWSVTGLCTTDIFHEMYWKITDISYTQTVISRNQQWLFLRVIKSRKSLACLFFLTTASPKDQVIKLEHIYLSIHRNKLIDISATAVVTHRHKPADLKRDAV